MAWLVRNGLNIISTSPTKLARNLGVPVTDVTNPDGTPKTNVHAIWGIDLDPLPGVPKQYWKLTGDVLEEMTQAEKDAVDAAMEEEQAQSRIGGLRAADLVTVLTAIVNEERTNRSTPVAPITEEQFKNYCRNKLGI